MSSADQGDRTSERITVRLLQTDPHLGDVVGNLERLDSLVSADPQADLVIAPELATHGYHLGLLDGPVPLAADDPRLVRLGRHGPTVIAGFAERDHGTYNSAAIISDGSVAVQRKISLPHYRQWEERRHFVPGDTVDVHDIAGARVAVLICNDMWQPALPWLAAHAGAEVLVVPVNSVVSDAGSSTAGMWDTILRHAALTLQTYVVFVNRVGLEGGGEFWGGSRVVSPTGEVMAQLGAEPGDLTVSLDLTTLRDLRKEWPLLADPPLATVAREAARLDARSADV
ncbi:nitrilase-related carbon-nitrogen hydrolase [Nocardioides sp.]|uniref:nitrilase-related carbon-nitrogen hydrolase n=1 Tax=Nocardioides sp. TaxID=35761 RepID=UPI002B72BFBB|nr:nitrilase-related carbon-nitrogen hydrolase [Nocardioides sp.]HXH77172.1 nitrilase-related carbon-nitrogen hydrolase [Nocardioides sp.]